MNGFVDHGLDENAFGEKKGFSEGIRSFDAFRKDVPNLLRFHSIDILDLRSLNLFANMSSQTIPPFEVRPS